MANESLFLSTFVYLCAAVISVPIAKKLGLGSVLGYLSAGMIIGPYVLSLIGEEGQDVMHFAEFGVVLMLFVVGLELKPSLLWRLRALILGLGGLQVVLTTAAIALIAAMGYGQSLPMAIAIGLTLALSSTAIVLQTLNEKGLMRSSGGQSSFAVLLFQDIAVIPMLVIFPLLATLEPTSPVDGDPGHGASNSTLSAVQHWVAELPGPAHALVVLGGIALVIAAGLFLVRPALRTIARTRLREIFTAFALLLVIGIALFMTALGLSPALGAFLAGVVLANSEYRHELESAIEPFKGLLLGVFFISVGASIDFQVIAAFPGIIALSVLGLIAVKSLILFLLGYLFHLASDQRTLFSLGLAQSGEFAFVLLSFAVGSQVLPVDTAQFLVALVALSMACTPLLLLFEEKVLRPRFGTLEAVAEEADAMNESAPVILAGFGRFGNFVGRFLRSQDVEVTVLENDSDHVDMLRKFGLKTFYGDALRVDLLASAGAAEAKVLIIALDEEDSINHLVASAKKHFPHLQIYCRAAARLHEFELVDQVDHVVHEHAGSAIDLGVEVLKGLGRRAHSATRAGKWFKHQDRVAARELATAKKKEEDKTYISLVRQRITDIEEQFRSGRGQHGISDERAWNTASLRKEIAGDAEQESESNRE